MKAPIRWVEAAKIVLLAIMASIIYGVIHDQFTARTYLPYFNDWPPHAMYFQHPNPTVVGLYWGVVATWWVGLILGIVLAWVSTSGTGNWWSWRMLIKPLFVLVGVTGYLAGACGFIGFYTRWVHPSVAGPAVPADEVRDINMEMFTIVYSSHIGSYAFGTIGGLVVAFYVWRKRSRAALRRFHPIQQND